MRDGTSVAEVSLRPSAAARRLAQLKRDCEAIRTQHETFVAGLVEQRIRERTQPAAPVDPSARYRAVYKRASGGDGRDSASASPPSPARWPHRQFSNASSSTKALINK